MSGSILRRFFALETALLPDRVQAQRGDPAGKGKSVTQPNAIRGSTTHPTPSAPAGRGWKTLTLGGHLFRSARSAFPAVDRLFERIAPRQRENGLNRQDSWSALGAGLAAHLRLCPSDRLLASRISVWQPGGYVSSRFMGTTHRKPTGRRLRPSRNRRRISTTFPHPAGGWSG